MIEYTVKVGSDGFKAWYLNNARHREDGPAIEDGNGFKEWWLNGKRHGEDGPAVEYSNGYKEWWLNGKLHREDGPAVERSDGDKEWWLNGKKLTEKEFNTRMKPKNTSSCNGNMVTIDGKQYKLTEVE